MDENSDLILITGASSGIGEATARLFGRYGYRTVLAARRLDRLQAVAEEIQQAGGQAFPLQTDLAQLKDIEALVGTVQKEFGKIDILFNNAGFGRLGWLETLEPLEDIQAQFQVNLIGMTQLTRAVLPGMIQRRGGHIINMASLASFVATPTYSIYAASKFATRGFTDALRREVGIWGIKVSGIYPGGVATEFSRHAGIARKTGRTTPNAVRLSADQVAAAVLSVAQNPRRSMVIPGVMRGVVWLNALFPGMIDWVTDRWFVRPERSLE